MVDVAWRRRFTGASLLLFGILCAMLIVAPPASAHAVLESTSPRVGEVLAADAIPTRIELRFNEPVEVALGALQVVTADGSRVDVRTVQHPDGAGERVSTGLGSRLAQGSYLVLWRVVSADSHPVHGSFTFSIGRIGPVADAPNDAGSYSLELAVAVARFAGYGGLLLVVGGIAFFAWCLPSHWAGREARRLRGVGVALAGAAAVGGFGLQAALDVGGGWERALDPSTLNSLAGTRLGHAHLLRLVLLAIISVTLYRTRNPSRGALALIGAELALALGTVASEGHNGQSLPAFALDVLHLAAAGIWFGGLVVLATIVLPQRRRSQVHEPGTESTSQLISASAETGSGSGSGLTLLERHRSHVPPPGEVQRFSRLALICVVTLAGTGAAQALRQVPDMAALIATTYGRLLIVKIALAALVLAAATVSRAALRIGRIGTDTRERTLARSVGTETLLLLVVLAVTSALVASTPASAAYRPAQDRTVSAGPVSVQLTAEATAFRTYDLHLSTFGANGLPLDVPNIQAEARPLTGELSAVSIRLFSAGTAHLVAHRVTLPQVGTWTLTLVVRTGEFDAYTATTTLTVR